MSDTTNTADEKPQNVFDFDITSDRKRQSQEYYEGIKAKFAEERDLRLDYRPEGTAQYTSELTGDLEKYEIDPFAEEWVPRDPIDDTVEVLFIGGGFSALLTSARLRERGVESIRIVERGADVGGTWYWNRYPGRGLRCCPPMTTCPLLDETRLCAEQLLRLRGRKSSPTARLIAKTATTSTTSPCSRPTVQGDPLERGRPSCGNSRDRPRRSSMTAKFVVCRERHSGEAEALQDKGGGDLQGPCPSIARASTMSYHRSTTWRT